MKKILFIVAGWYFEKTNFYDKIRNIVKENKSIDVFISSHKKKNEISNNFLKKINNIPNIQLHFYENKGFDWGMYSQAMKTIGLKYKDYDYVFFMQDDIEILKNDFYNIFISHLKQKNLKVLGNSSNSKNYPYTKTHPHVIEWLRQSKWKKDIKLANWSTVRGSFFLADAKIFDKIDSIPFKDGSHSGFGNWGVITFAGLVADNFGNDSISTISDKYLKSDYIIEYLRGEKYVGEEKKQSEIVERELKLHLGCGKNYFDGYLNIDQAADSCADIISDILKIEFLNSSISEIVMIHLIEHFNRFEAEELISKIYKWLKKGGKLIIECPDILKVAKLIIKNRKKFEILENDPYGIRGFYGEPFQKMNIGDYHKWGYSEFTLGHKLRCAGFSKIEVEKPLAHGQRVKRDLRIVATK